MGKSNVEQFNLALKHLGEGCRKCCSMANNCCCYFVCMGFREADNKSLFYNGVTVTYCPNAIKWCKNVLAQIPPYIAMKSDVIFFDWELNGIPNHIGYVDHRISDAEIATLEGNTTSSYVVARRTRATKYVQGIYRPHFTPTAYDASKPLVIDGQFDYSSIAVMQKWLGVKVDAILGQDTIKAMQKKLGVTADGSWGVNTSKALQKLIGTTVDGVFGEKSVKAFQTYLNKVVFNGATPTPTPTSTPTPVDDGKLDVDGNLGTKSVKRMQEFFGTKVDGIISGQNKNLYKYYGAFDKDVVQFGKGGSACVEKLQKWLGVKEDGILGETTVKAWQKKIGVSVDGSFGTNSAKIWQRYLNEHDKAVYPAPKPTPTPKPAAKTLGDKVADEALKWIGKCPYVSGGTNIHKGVDCTGFVQEMYRLCGRKLSNKLSSWGRSIGKDIGKAKRGDVLTYKDKSGIHHAIYVGNGMVVHASNKKDGIKKSKWNSMSRPLVGIRRPWK